MATERAPSACSLGAAAVLVAAQKVARSMVQGASTKPRRTAASFEAPPAPAGSGVRPCVAAAPLAGLERETGHRDARPTR
jgi:hypothetical protein